MAMGDLEIFVRNRNVLGIVQGRYTQPYVYGFRVNMSSSEWVFGRPAQAGPNPWPTRA